MGREIVSRITVFVTLLIICLWSYWGINETFHEGWYHKSLLQNLKLTFVQYLSVPVVLISFSLIAINYRRIGFVLFSLLGLFAVFFFNSNAGRVVIFIPTILLALGFYLQTFKNKKIVILAFIIIPLLITLSFGAPQLYRVENRFNDNNFGMRTITGNNIELTWAPQGVGFPLEGTSWLNASRNCARLSKEGMRLENDEVNLWRLPTREEIVRSLTRGNKNAGGFIGYNSQSEYKIKPEKETPLWNPHSQIIYYWTNESKDEAYAYLVAFNGNILARNKNSGANYQGYRCVK